MLRKEFQSLKMKANFQPHQGVTTASEWVGLIRSDQTLQPADKSFKDFLDSVKIDGWIRSGEAEFPPASSLEAGEGGTQDFVTRIFELFEDGNLKIHAESKKSRGEYVKTSVTHTLLCYPVLGAHSSPSFGTRKPDNVHRSGQNVIGVHTIVLLGDNKRSAEGKFTDEEIGHVLDMSRQLLMEHQKKRILLYCYLTDGYRFQYFKIDRIHDDFSFQESDVKTGVLGWQVST